MVIYSVFILNGTNVAFNKLKPEELDNTYRYKALKKALKKSNEQSQIELIADFLKTISKDFDQ